MTPNIEKGWIEVSSQEEDAPKWNIWGIVMSVAFIAWAGWALASYVLDSSSSVLIGDRLLISSIELAVLFLAISLMIMACSHVKKIQAWFDRKN